MYGFETIYFFVLNNKSSGTGKASTGHPNFNQDSSTAKKSFSECHWNGLTDLKISIFKPFHQFSNYPLTRNSIWFQRKIVAFDDHILKVITKWRESTDNMFKRHLENLEIISAQFTTIFNSPKIFQQDQLNLDLWAR